MALPDAAYFQLTDDTRIVRILNGMWQVSGAHGNINPQEAVRNMVDYYEDGFNTWDLADHYGPAEDFIGVFKQTLARLHGDDAPEQIQAFTKWVPRPARMTRDTVEAAIDISRRRMQMDTLDMLQFHWWDYGNSQYMNAMRHMQDLQNAGKIKHLALTNFDTQRVREFIDADIPIVSNQVQYSIIDRRPEVQMVAACTEHGVSLLTYGTLCGGFLSEKYLNKPEPSNSQIRTASKRKYKNMIDLWGGWGLFQQLLTVLKNIADKHDVSIANVAARYILDKPAVAGVIAGVRLGISDHREDNKRVFDLTLDADDLDIIHAVTEQADDLFQRIGDCGDEYRR